MNIRDDLKAFVDGELSPERMEEVRIAVASDPALQREVEVMRVLGFEIKRMAEEPAVQGRADTIAKVKGRAWPWWHPYGLGGRLAIAGTLGVLIVAVFFPVFAQSKYSARTGTVASELSKAETDRLRAGNGPGGRGGGGEGAQPGFIGGHAAEDDAKRVGRAGVSDWREGATGGFSNEYQPPSETLHRKSKPAVTKPRAPQAPPQTGTTVIPIPNDKRMVIQNADMARRVDDVEKAREEAEAMTKGFGGYVESSSISGEQDRNPVANLILRIPNTRFDAAMKRLRDMGEKISENVTGQDVTKEYADIEGHLKVLKAEADSYLTMLRAARKVGELIEIKDRLSQVRQEIASYEQQRLALKDLSNLSTISVRFEQKPKVGAPVENGSPIQDAWVSAVNGLKAVGTFLVQTVIFVFVFAPVWIPPVVLFWWLGKKAKA